MKNWQLNLLIVAYVVVYSARVTAVRLIDDGNAGQLRDLLLISIAGIIGEFSVVGVMYVYHCIANPEQLHNQNIRFVGFLLPAACDFVETTILIFGVSQVLDSMDDMYKVTVIMLTVIITNYVFQAWTQIVSLSAALGGVILAAGILYKAEEKNIVQSNFSIFMGLLGVRAILQAFQSSLIQKCFEQQPGLPAFTAQCAMCLWKLFWLMLAMPFLDLAPAPTGVEGKTALQGIRETLDLGPGALSLVILQAVLVGLQAMLGVSVIKEGNAVVQ